MKLPQLIPTVSAMLAAVAVSFSPRPLNAADHGDAPALAQDLGSDINDVFLFLDPTDNKKVVLIATVHGFLVPGEVPNFAVFDENIRYRFEIYNDHVNHASPVLSGSASKAAKARYAATVKPNRTIDFTFAKRAVGPDAQSNPPGSVNPTVPVNLRRPLRQEVVITLDGFPSILGVKNNGKFSADSLGEPLLVTPFSVGANAPNFLTQEVDVTDAAAVSGGGIVQFFAGEVDDPFFFDIPAFTAFIDSLRQGSPNTAPFSRARDTFAGYNTLAIAISLPQELLKGPDGSIIGVDFLTQRKHAQLITANGVKGAGAFKTVDRMGNPTVNVALLPFDIKNSYNAASARQDVQLKFASAILETLTELGTSANFQGILANLAVAKGDLLQLDLNVTNTGPNFEARFPNGRRLQDDTVDIVLTLLNNGNALGDNVNSASATVATNLTPSFPFLGKPNQPQFNPSPASEDNTRN